MFAWEGKAVCVKLSLHWINGPTTCLNLKYRFPFLFWQKVLKEKRRELRLLEEQEHCILQGKFKNGCKNYSFWCWVLDESGFSIINRPPPPTYIFLPTKMTKKSASFNSMLVTLDFWKLVDCWFLLSKTELQLCHVIFCFCTLSWNQESTRKEHKSKNWQLQELWILIGTLIWLMQG